MINESRTKISIITVSYNAVKTIENTILSVINQTYSCIEYIIIDGGSTDGTVDIIRKYENKISYWISEPDKGIYDAMNKGIQKATGKWLNFMNCGDTFYNNKVISDIFENRIYKDIDVIYGSSQIKDEKGNIFNSYSNGNVEQLRFEPIYRHGASFVRTNIHKQYLFDLNKIPQIGYALDYDVIYRLYKDNRQFKRVEYFILIYEENGVSNHPIRSRYYVYKITSESKFSFIHFKFLLNCIFNYYILVCKKNIISLLKYLNVK